MNHQGDGRLIPSFFIRDCSVVRLRPRHPASSQIASASCKNQVVAKGGLTAGSAIIILVAKRLAAQAILHFASSATPLQIINSVFVKLPLAHNMTCHR